MAPIRMIFDQPGTILREIQTAHPRWTHQQCLDEQERVALAAFARYAASIRETTDATRIIPEPVK